MALACDRAPASVASLPSPASSPPRARSSATQAQRERFLGVVLARASTNVAPRRDGRVVSVNVRLGEHVARGDLLAKLDVALASSEVEMATASQRAAQVALAKATTDRAGAEEQARRQSALHREGLASEQDLVASNQRLALSRLEVDAATAQLGEKTARLRQLKLARDEGEVRAPFDGVVAARYVDPGANVTPAIPIVHLLGSSEAFVRFAAAPEHATRLVVGREVSVEPSAGTGVWRARIERIAPDVDAASRMVVIEAGLSSADGATAKAVPGSEVYVAIDNERTP
jgi:RND family efflux transporter MFP subunit